MKYGLWIAGCVLALAVPVILMSGWLARSGPDSDAAANTSESAMARSTPKEPALGSAVNVVIDNFTFDPPKLTITAGTKVTWINHDDVPHTATSSVRPRAFDSGTLDTDEKFSQVFTAPGTYDYFCAVHPKMTAQIIVK